jgi:hypothetical protein
MKILNYNLYTKTYFYQRGNRVGTHNIACRCYKPLQVTQHLINEGNIQECKLCNESFDSPAKLQCHLIEHTYQNTEYTCIVCLKVFRNAAEIQSHSFEHDPEARLYRMFPSLIKCRVTWAWISSSLLNDSWHLMHWYLCLCVAEWHSNSSLDENLKLQSLHENLFLSTW